MARRFRRHTIEYWFVDWAGELSYSRGKQPCNGILLVSGVNGPYFKKARIQPPEDTLNRNAGRNTVKDGMDMTRVS